VVGQTTTAATVPPQVIPRQAPPALPRAGARLTKPFVFPGLGLILMGLLLLSYEKVLQAQRS